MQHGVIWSWLAAATMVACTQLPRTEPPPPPPPPAPAEVAEDEPARDLTSLVGFRWRSKNEDGTWQLTYHFRADGTYYATGHPAWRESGRVAVLQADEDRLVLRLSERTFDGKQDPDVTRELVFADDGASFVLNEDRFERIERVAYVAVEDHDEGE